VFCTQPTQQQVFFLFFLFFINIEFQSSDSMQAFVNRKAPVQIM